MFDKVKGEHGATDFNLMIRGFTIFSFVYFPDDITCDGYAWQLVIFNKKWEHNF